MVLQGIKDWELHFFVFSFFALLGTTCECGLLMILNSFIFFRYCLYVFLPFSFFFFDLSRKQSFFYILFSSEYYYISFFFTTLCIFFSLSLCLLR